MSSGTIAVFDSGIGGLTVVREIIAQVPNAPIVYFGDTARVPYGSRSTEIIRRYAREDTELLLQQNPSLIVVACGTVSSVALDVVRQTAGAIEVIGMIPAASTEALASTKNGRIGIIGTEATIGSNAYGEQINRYTNDRAIEIFSNACPLFVPLAEEGWQDHQAARMIAAEYLQPMIDAQIDTLILGCTHYPVLHDVIASVMGPSVALINPGEASARVVAQTYRSSGVLSTTAAEHLIMVSDIPRKFQSLGERFLGYTLPPVRRVVYKEAWVVA